MMVVGVAGQKAGIPLACYLTHYLTFKKDNHGKTYAAAYPVR
jgi:hypothetical protein